MSLMRTCEVVGNVMDGWQECLTSLSRFLAVIMVTDKNPQNNRRRDDERGREAVGAQATFKNIKRGYWNLTETWWGHLYGLEC